jgi:hypothetical protein
MKLDSMKENGKSVRLLRIHLRNPKEQKLAQGVTVELFQTGNFLCPVAAFLKWRNCSKLQLSKLKPAIRLETGQNYTGRDFNKDLRLMMSQHVDYNKGTISSHSFRGGLASLMASLGYPDHEIMTIGRWRSEVKIIITFWIL